MIVAERIDYEVEIDGVAYRRIQSKSDTGLIITRWEKSFEMSNNTYWSICSNMEGQLLDHIRYQEGLIDKIDEILPRV